MTATRPTVTAHLRPTAMADKRIHAQERCDGVERRREQTAGVHAGHQRVVGLRTRVPMTQGHLAATREVFFRRLRRRSGAAPHVAHRCV